MAPNTAKVCPEPAAIDTNTSVTKERKKGYIVWRNVILMSYLHLASLYGIYLVFTSAKLYTTIFAYILYICGGLGITAGVHRLWSHKAYKAKLPLRIILGIFNTLAFQNSIYEWSRDHRVHHKFSDTDADPHNAKRGFFFSHVGWLLVRKNPQIMEKGKKIDMSDLLEDSVVTFQKKYYHPLMIMTCFVVPTLIPMWLWGETFINSLFVATYLRYAVTLNATWLVNSWAHYYGGKPYDKTMKPAENVFVAIGALGEGWHNYHHTFPWDYKTAELGNYTFNFTNAFLDFFTWIGWAYDLRTTSPEIIMKRAARTGDGTYVAPAHYPSVPKDSLVSEEEKSFEGGVWGWDDKDLDPEIKAQATIVSGSPKKE